MSDDIAFGPSSTPPPGMHKIYTAKERTFITRIGNLDVPTITLERGDCLCVSTKLMEPHAGALISPMLEWFER